MFHAGTYVHKFVCVHMDLMAFSSLITHVNTHTRARTHTLQTLSDVESKLKIAEADVKNLRSKLVASENGSLQNLSEPLHGVEEERHSLQVEKQKVNPGTYAYCRLYTPHIHVYKLNHSAMLHVRMYI